MLHANEYQYERNLCKTKEVETYLDENNKEIAGSKEKLNIHVFLRKLDV
jgi:uncharacterized protein (UPF0276 family)